MNEVRLIDADALKKKFDDYSKANPNISGIFELAKIIVDNAPTVSDRYDEGYAQGYVDGSTGADWKGGAE